MADQTKPVNTGPSPSQEELDAVMRRATAEAHIKRMAEREKERAMRPAAAAPTPPAEPPEEKKEELYEAEPAASRRRMLRPDDEEPAGRYRTR